jgi:membrane-bound lytic murein transglycosylase D
MTIIGKNAADYGLDEIRFETPIEYDSIELESPTHMMLIAEALDRPLSEVRELNPSVLHSVAPAGHMVRVPKGTTPQVEAALHAVPASRRDTWRVHRLENGETLSELARRFNTTQASIVAANRDEMPSSGEWVAIPAAYPGDRLPVKARKPLTTRAAVAIHTAAKPNPTASRPASPSHPSAAVHPAPAVRTTTIAQQHKAPAVKPSPKSVSKVQTHSAPRR